MSNATNILVKQIPPDNEGGRLLFDKFIFGLFIEEIKFKDIHNKTLENFKEG